MSTLSTWSHVVQSRDVSHHNFDGLAMSGLAFSVAPLSELIRLYETPRQLRRRGANIMQYSPAVLNFSRSAFCHVSPTIWNNLPETVISDITVSTDTFKFRLKTALYSRAFLH